MMPLNRALDVLATSCRETRQVRICVEDGLGRITAAPVYSPAAIPSGPIALQDGWAVAAEETLGASPYAPALANTTPRRVAFGDFLPDFADAVLPLPNVAANPSSFEVLSSAAPGDGTRARGGDFAEGEVIVAAGKKLEMPHIALLQLAGIENVTVRLPHIRILSDRNTGKWLASKAKQEGAESRAELFHELTAEHLVENLAQSDADLIIAVGFGNIRDIVTQAIAVSGRMLFDGVAVRPGEMICGGLLSRINGLDNTKLAFSGEADGASRVESHANGLPILFIPGRMESLLTAWLLLVRPCLRRLAGAAYREVEESLPLTRKIASMPGLSELALVRRVTSSNDKIMLWEPLATGDITFSAIAHADAWLLVEAGCEGYPAGQSIGAKLL